MNNTQKVGISMAMSGPKAQIQTEAAITISEELEKLNYEVILRDSESDVEKQISSINYLINEGCEIIIIWATPVGIQNALANARSAGIKVITFYNLILNAGAADYYVGPNHREAGRLQAEYILNTYGLDPSAYIEFLGTGDLTIDPLIIDGAMEVFQNGGLYNVLGPTIITEDMTDFTPIVYNSRNQGVGAYMCFSDWIARRIIPTVQAWGADIIITGYGDSEETQNNIAQGWQEMTVSFDMIELAKGAARLADDLLQGLTPGDAFSTNGYGDCDGICANCGYYSNGCIPGKILKVDTNDDIITPPPKILTHITISGSPTEIHYRGESFKPAGITVTAHYLDGTTNNVTDSCNYSPSELSMGVNTIIVSYKGKTETLTITVKDRILQNIIAKNGPHKNTYVEGDSFEPAGMTVTAKYNLGRDRVIPLAKLDWDLVSWGLGQNIVKVWFVDDGGSRNKSNEIEYTVKVYEKLTFIEITKQPDKLSYLKGERFNRTGMVVKAHYSSGLSKTISTGSLVVSPSSIQFQGASQTAQVTISYVDPGGTAKKNITVYKKTGIYSDDCNIAQDFGASGCGAINLHSGQMSYMYSDFSSADSVMAISITRIYKDDIGDYGVGFNWKLNLHQEVIRENNKYNYIDGNGKSHCFEEDFEDNLTVRSSIRNEDLGLDFFIEDNRYILIDRGNNALVFENKANKYRLTEMHQYPSRPANPVNSHVLKIEYNTSGKISKVTGGKNADGSQPYVVFNYTGASLANLSYNYNGSTTPVVYEYNTDNALSRIKYYDSGVNSSLLHSTSFIYTTSGTGTGAYTSGMEIKNEFIKDTNGTFKSLAYLIDSSARVYKYSIGYGTTDREETTVKYTAPVERNGNGSITKSTYLEYKDTISVVSFNDNGTTAQYSYDKNSSYDKVRKVNSAISNGFSYRSLSETYSDTLDLVNENFDASTTHGWSGGAVVNSKSVNGSSCLRVSGTIKKIFSNNNLGNGTTLYLSLWALAESQAVNVNVEISGETSYAFNYTFDENFTGKWQYAAFNLGKIKNSDTITVNISGGTYCIDDFRLTKAPYEVSDKLSDEEHETKFNNFGNIEAASRYNPVDETISRFNYIYNDDYQIKEVTEKINSQTVNRVVYNYSGGFLTEALNYCGSSSNYIKEYKHYTNGVLDYSVDANNVRTNYSLSKNLAQTTTIGENNSPDVTTKDTCFNNSSRLKETAIDTTKNEYQYDSKGLLNDIKHNNFSTKTGYDTFGGLKTVDIGANRMVTYNYSNNGKFLDSVVYSNGDSLSYTYDNKDRPKTITANQTQIASIDYAGDDSSTITTHTNGVKYTSRAVNKAGITGEFEVEHSGISRKLKAKGRATNNAGNVLTTDYYIDDSATPFEHQVTMQDRNGLLKKLERTYRGGTIDYQYNSLYQLENKIVSLGSKQYKTNYSFKTIANESNRRTNLISQEAFYINSGSVDALQYTYYANGNVEKVLKDNALQAQYFYDKYNRLTYEYNYVLNVAYNYTYDNGGNIASKKAQQIINGVVQSTVTETTYGYTNTNWPDQLTSYNGQTISYDAMGNPTSYQGKSITWNGRLLTSIGGLAMKYDCSSLRTHKGSKVYYWQSDRLLAERWMEGTIEKFIYYYYDESGVCGMNFNGTDYHYRKNVFGDIIAIYDTTGNLQCRYIYDAWGNHKAYKFDNSELSTSETTHIGNINPFRYRSYYFDTETGLYYLQTRYYDPQVGRFVNADDAIFALMQCVALNGINFYNYCGNNPVMRTDATGYAWWNPFSWDWKGAAKAVGDFFSDVGQAIGDAAEAAWDWTKNTATAAWNWTVNTAMAVGNWVKDTAIAVGNWAKDTAVTAWNWTRNAAVTAYNWTVNTAISVGNWIKNKAMAAWNWTKNAGIAVWDFVTTNKIFHLVVSLVGLVASAIGLVLAIVALLAATVVTFGVVFPVVVAAVGLLASVIGTIVSIVNLL